MNVNTVVAGGLMITRRKFVSLTCVGGLASVLPGKPRPAQAQQANHATARMLVGFTAGGAIDVIARMLVEGMKGYSSSFIVDNRPGAGGRLALGALKGGPAEHGDDPDAGLQPSPYSPMSTRRLAMMRSRTSLRSPRFVRFHF